MKKDKIFLLFSVLILFSVYFFAGLFKIIRPLQFYESIKAYEILREPILIAFVASFVPFLEVFSAIFLLIPGWKKSSSIVIFFMSLFFLFVIISAYMRGLKIDCGCFGGFLLTETGLTSIIRNIFLLIFSGFVLLKSD
ncbi:MAG: MauE/DoxX family redox-associated membrane protein [Candidatus Aminicenantia bacterium]